jgi:hypothetical protein
MKVITRIKSLEERNDVLRKRIADLEELNAKQFDELHKAQIRIQQLEAENAYLRTLESN